MPFTDLNLLSMYGGGAEELFGLWVRNLMGFKPSPYNSVKVALVVEEVCNVQGRLLGDGSGLSREGA